MKSVFKMKKFNLLSGSSLLSVLLGTTLLVACAQQGAAPSSITSAAPLGNSIISRPVPPASSNTTILIEPSSSVVQTAKPYEIETGEFNCGMGGKLIIQKDTINGQYLVSAPAEKRSFKMRVTPVTSGAVRLDDINKAGFLLILANKSMLFDAKKGSRIADNCITPMQKQFHS